MKVTNYNNLPLPVVRALTPKRTPSERREGADFSVTELIGPPRIHQLREAYWDYLTTDASEGIWSLLGQGVHRVLEENAADSITERRLMMNVGGKVISGQFDLMSDGVIADYKVCKTWAVAEGLKPEWEVQLNCYAELARRNGMEVRGLVLMAFLRDWVEYRYRPGGNYPASDSVVFDVPLWHPDAVMDYIHARLEAHAQVMPMCTDEERWPKMREPGFNRCEKFCPVRTVCEHGLKPFDDAP